LTHKLIIFLCIIGVLFGGLWILWFLAYDADQIDENNVAVSHLSAPVIVSRQTNGSFVIKADNTQDAFAGLGFVDGSTRPWQILMLRQIALGRSAEWFGVGTSGLDRLARQLSFAGGAKSGYESLNQSQKALLDAYASGINAALKLPETGRNDVLIMNEITAEPWYPWQSIALERLFAWLATSPHVSDHVRSTFPASGLAFMSANLHLRSILKFGGFENSAAWWFRQGKSRYVFHRQVYGSTATSPFREVKIQIGRQPPISGTTITGIPVFTSGKSGASNWAMLLHSKARFTRISFNQNRLQVHRERFRDTDGNEKLVSVARLEGSMPFLPEDLSAETDSTWALDWSGFSTNTDWESWTSLSTDAIEPFHLFTGDRIETNSAGDIVVKGAPMYDITFGKGAIISNTSWTPYLASRLGMLTDSTSLLLPIDKLMDDDRSIWAEEFVPKIIALIKPVPDRSFVVNEALTYLRNWNYEYGGSSISASLLETLLTKYYVYHQSRPDPNLDPTQTDARIWYSLLSESTTQLSDSLGSDISQWRWEVIQPDRRFYAPWSGGSPLFPNGHFFFEPISKPGRGHPSTLAWGDSPIYGDRGASGAWEGWRAIEPDSVFHYRQRNYIFDHFLARYLVPNAPLPFTTLPGKKDAHLIHLVPIKP